MSELSKKQIERAHQMANTRATAIAELLALDGVPTDAATAAALMILSLWNWRKCGKDNAALVRILRWYADNIEAGKRVK